MASPVELPAESIPFNESALQHVLAAGVSSSQDQVRRATDQLKEWETKEGFYSLLQDVFIDKSAPKAVRLLAITQFKNGVDKYWRKAATNAIRPTERNRIRSRLIESGLNEDDDRLAKFNAIAAAKIARFDFPGQWPDLIKEIVNIIRQAADPLTPRALLSRALLLTLALIKELSTVRLQRARASLLENAPALFSILNDVYYYRVSEWQQIYSTDSTQEDDAKIARMKESEAILKIMRRLFVAGFEFPDRNEQLQEFWQSSQQLVQQYQNLLLQPKLPDKYVELLGSHLKQLTKLHVNVARDHPVSFGLLPDTAPLIQNYWSSANAYRRQQSDGHVNSELLNQVFDSFNLRAILIIRASLRIVVPPSVTPFKYKGSEGKDDPPKAREYLKTQAFTNQFIKDIFGKIVTYFLVILPDEIEDWTTEPEEWEIREEGDENAYDQSVRSCAERLLLDICVHYKDDIMGELMSLANYATDAAFSVTGKDAVYAAIGIAAPMLQHKFDFNNFLTTTLVGELQQSDPSRALIRRRIAVLLAQWIGIDVSDANRVIVYQMYQHLLDKSVAANELLVRITAGKRFGDVANEWNFKPEAFAPYAPTILSQLIGLMQEVEMEETQIALLNTVGAVIERMEQQVKPFAEQIVVLLPPLWNSSQRAHLMKQAIVAVLTKLVNSLEGDSGPLHPVVLPIVREALQPGSSTQQFLLEDALELWVAVVSQAQTPITSDLLALAHLLPELFELETSHIEKAVRIQESYILLAPSEMLLNDERREEFFASATSLLTVKKADIIDSVCKTIELSIRAVEALGGTQAVNLIVNGLWEIGFLSHILNSINKNWDTHTTTGPNRKDPPQDWKNEADYFAILSRIILASTETFLTLVQNWAVLRGRTFDEAMALVLDEWFENTDAVNMPDQIKLLALALTKLLETGQPWMLRKLQDLMSLWTGVLLELRDGDEDVGGDSLVYKQPERAANGTGAPEQDRRRAVLYSDPVHTVNLSQFVKHTLSKVVAGCGGEQAFQEQWLVNVDKDVVASFGELGVM